MPLLLRKEKILPTTLATLPLLVLPTALRTLPLLVLKLLVLAAVFTKMLLSSPPATAAVSASVSSMGLFIAFPHIRKGPHNKTLARLIKPHNLRSRVRPADFFNLFWKFVNH